MNSSRYLTMLIFLTTTMLFTESVIGDTQEEYHISQPFGPPPVTLIYDGQVEAEKVYYVEASPENGFHWPYYFTLSEAVGKSQSILVQPNNDGMTGASLRSREYFASIFNEQAWADFGRHLGVIVLTPVFPRPALETADENLYVHALSRASMLSTDESLRRIDLQLLAMTNNLRRILKQQEINTSDGILLWGFSAAGDFVTRFTAMHPEKVSAMAAGGLGGFPILPVPRYRETTLNYPVGIADLSSITGNTFNLESFRTVPVLMLQGSEDENDSVMSDANQVAPSDYGSDSYSRDQAIFINQTFGEHPIDRIEKVKEIYRTLEMQHFNYTIVPDAQHKDRPLKPLVLDFFKRVLEEEALGD